METAEKTTFSPEAIATDWRSYNQALTAWRKYTDNTSELFDWILSFLNRDSFKPEDFLTLIGQEPEQFLVKLFELSGRAPKGFELSQLVKLGLIKNEVQAEVLESLQAYNNTRTEAEKLFRYDVIKLFQDQYFDLTEDFKRDLEQHFTSFTTTAIQNEALEQINKLAEVCNWFVLHGIAKPQIGRRGLEQLLLSLRSSDDRLTYVPNLSVFKLQYWVQRLK
jgi:hypothetical protein